MKTFPDFIKNPINMVSASQQNTADIEGYYYQGADETQIAFWECHADRISQKHTHPFDEYMVCVSGEYTAYFNEEEIILKPGDELVYPNRHRTVGKMRGWNQNYSCFWWQTYKKIKGQQKH